MNPIFDFFFEIYSGRPTHLIILEAIAFVTGIASVILAKKEHIGVYPTGLIATTITVYLFWVDQLLGDMMMNFYYSIMSIYGWYNWARKKEGDPVVHISKTTSKERWIGAVLCLFTMGVTYGVYRGFDVDLGPLNYIDILTSGIFFTAMWYMANKKIANWSLWILGDCITVPLYGYRGWGMFALQFLVFTILAIQGYRAWKRSYQSNLKEASLP